jgi:hypothetical protein
LGAERYVLVTNKALQDQMVGNHCWSCGADNPAGLHLKGYWDGAIALTDVGSLPAAMQRSGVLHSRAYPLKVPGIADADRVWPPSIVTFEMYRTPPRPSGPGTFCREGLRAWPAA